MVPTYLHLFLPAYTYWQALCGNIEVNHHHVKIFLRS